MKKVEKSYLEWDMYFVLMKTLIDKIKESKIKFDYIFGPCRGGYIPAVMISHELSVPVWNLDSKTVWSIDVGDMSPAQAEKYIQDFIKSKKLNNPLSGKTFLIVDDIIDSSETIKKLVKKFKVNDNKVYTASIYKHQKCSFIPNWFVCRNEKWIVFPYEKD